MILPLLLQLAISAPVIRGDTAGHLDLLVGQTAQLSVIGVAKWSSGNSAVASVSSKGVVTAKARGYATITATVGAEKATIRACVTAVSTEVLPWEVTGISTSSTLPTSSRYTVQMMAHVQLAVTGSQKWGPCVHWAVDSASKSFASIDRAGVLHSPKSVSGVIAAIGPTLP